IYRYPDGVSSEIKKCNMVSVYQLLVETVQCYGNRVAIVSDEGEEITYKNLKEKVDFLASAWQIQGMKKGERIGLMLENSPYYIISYYAAMKLGLVIVQINPNYTLRELLVIVNDSELLYLIVDESNAENGRYTLEMGLLEDIYLTESIGKQKMTLSSLIEQENQPFVETSINIEEDIAVIQYTGGTTGGIKGAMLTHANLVANVLQGHKIYEGKMKYGQELVLIITPVYHVYAMTCAMNLGVYIAATNILVKSYRIKETLEKINKYQPTILPGVPKIYSDIVNYPNVMDYRLDSLKFCTCGSALIPIEIIKRFENLTGTIIAEGYGLSEASPTTHRNLPAKNRKIGSIGIPLPNTDSKVVDENGDELPIGFIGELIIKGPQVMKGYWKRDRETNDTLKNKWLFTGDLAKQDDEGYFYIVGRKKELIITNGFNVYPQEVENVLFDHPDIKEVAVIGIDDDLKGEIIKAFIVVHSGATVNAAELIGYCYKELAPYKVPEKYDFLD